MTGLIQPLVWDVSQECLDRFQTYTAFTISADLYEALSVALDSVSADGQFSVPHRSLEVLVGWFSPDIAFVRREGDADRRSVLRFYYSGQPAAHSRKDLRDSLLLWLSVTGVRSTEASLETRLLQAVDEPANWTTDSLNTELRLADGRCAAPASDLLFDLLTQGVAQYLEGRDVAASAATLGRLVLSGLKGGPFDGRELFVFQPNQAPSGTGYWCEVIRIAATNGPEARNLRIVASLHTRNYRALTAKARFGRSQRRLDVFFRPAGGGNFVRHGEIPFRVRGEQDVQAKYVFKNGGELFKVLRTFGGPATLDAGSAPFNPVYGDGGIWILPRLGRVHGDADLPAGQGLGWGERDRFAASLDTLLQPIGLTRVAQVRRTAKRGLKLEKPWENPPQPKLENPSRKKEYAQRLHDQQGRRRSLVLKALANRPLRVVLLALRDGAFIELHRALEALLGAPDRRSDSSWTYNDGLEVQIASAKSSLLADPLPERPQATPEDLARRQKNIDKILRQRHETLLEGREDEVLEYLKGAVPWCGGKDPWIALVELKEQWRDSARDPYSRVYRLIAELGGLPQAILVDHRGEANEYKVPNALRDGIRMIGATGFDRIAGTRAIPAPERLRFVALWTVRRNEDRRSFESRDAFRFPLAVLADGGELKVALLSKDERSWFWVSYAEASVRIGRRDIPAFAKVGKDARRQKFAQFYKEVCESLVSDGIETVVLADAANIRQELTAFGNRDLNIGRFIVGGLAGSASLEIVDDGAYLSIVRLNAEPAKRATYTRVGTKHFTYGTFQEPSATRTYWAVRRPPNSMDLNRDWKAAMRSPRRALELVEGEGEHDADLIGTDRSAPVLEEIVVAVRSRAFSCDTLASLVRELRTTHVSWSSDTVLPYPLHEASGLEKHLK